MNSADDRVFEVGEDSLYGLLVEFGLRDQVCEQARLVEGLFQRLRHGRKARSADQADRSAHHAPIELSAGEEDPAGPTRPGYLHDGLVQPCQEVVCAGRRHPEIVGVQGVLENP